jgi:hypothetical protein
MDVSAVSMRLQEGFDQRRDQFGFLDVHQMPRARHGGDVHVRHHGAQRLGRAVRTEPREQIGFRAQDQPL